MTHWTEFGLNHNMPHFSARHKVDFPPPLQALIDERAAGLTEPLTGISTDGTIQEGLFGLEDTGVSTEPISEAAQAFLAALDSERRDRAVLPVDAEQRRTWLNIHPYVFRHGVMLEDLPQAQRELGLDLRVAVRLARDIQVQGTVPRPGAEQYLSRLGQHLKPTQVIDYAVASGWLTLSDDGLRLRPAEVYSSLRTRHCGTCQQRMIRCSRLKDFGLSHASRVRDTRGRGA